MTYDCREPLVTAIQLLAAFHEENWKSENCILRSAYNVVRNANHHLQVWRITLEPLLEEIDRGPLDELFEQIDDFVEPSRQCRGLAR